MEKKQTNWWRVSAILICAVFFLGSVCVLVDQSMAKGKKVDHKEGFALYTKKCLGCHDSVADPEKPGRTRDDWHLVINVMHGYGLDLSADEGDIITDLLYDLRRGMEREAG